MVILEHIGTTARDRLTGSERVERLAWPRRRHRTADTEVWFGDVCQYRAETRPGLWCNLARRLGYAGYILGHIYPPRGSHGTRRRRVAIFLQRRPRFRYTWRLPKDETDAVMPSGGDLFGVWRAL